MRVKDTYRPLGAMASEGLPPGLAAGIDAGLAVRAVDRPQTIALWRSRLALAQAPTPDATVIRPKARPAATPASRPNWSGLIAAAALGLVVLSTGSYFLVAPRLSPPVLAPHGMKGEEETQNKAAADAAAQQAQRKADDERAAAQQAAEEVRRKAAADAETKRLADEAHARAEADRQLAEQEATRKAAADAKQQADAQAAAASDKRFAEAAESALRLGQTERQRIQVALTSLGFETHGNDGLFGPRSREMIAAWQSAHGQPSTGFLNEQQHRLLIASAAHAIAKYDDEQKRRADEKKTEAEASLRTPQPATPGLPPQSGSNVATAAPANGGFDGIYSGGRSDKSGSQPISVQVRNGVGTGTWIVKRCNAQTDFVLRVYPDGNAILEVHGFNPQCQRIVATHPSHVVNNQVQFTWTTPDSRQDVALSRRVN